MIYYNKSNIRLAYECLIIQFIDCLNYIFICYYKKYKCDICYNRFKNKICLSKHIRYSHPEIFSFTESNDIENPISVHSMGLIISDSKSDSKSNSKSNSNRFEKYINLKSHNHIV